MPLIVAQQDLPASRIKRRSGVDVPVGISTSFIERTAATARSPSASHSQYDPGVYSSAHWHTVDQFQILLEGKGTFGRHKVEPYYVHFAHAYTPYGPLLADAECGWTFMTLRTRHDPGAQRMPGAADKLKSIAGRRPGQITRRCAFATPSDGAGWLDIGIQNEYGLFSRTLTLAPHARVQAPPPHDGDGQFIVGLCGSMMHGGREHAALTVVYVEPEEEAFEIRAGSDGLRALVLNFPRVGVRGQKAAPAGAVAPGIWKCELCEFIYREADGLPDDGIAAATRWQDIPDNWTCPDCGASKADFKKYDD